MAGRTKSLRVLGAGLALGLLANGAVLAQGAPRKLSPEVEARQQARFPQPIRVGAMKGWPVIETGGHYHHLGEVVGVFRTSDGDLELVMRTTGVFGVGARLVAPPLEAVSLVGPLVKIADLDKDEFNKLPTFKDADGAFLGPDEVVRIGVDRKY